LNESSTSRTLWHDSHSNVSAFASASGAAAAFGVGFVLVFIALHPTKKGEVQNR
jgi:hypothetical protein